MPPVDVDAQMEDLKVVLRPVADLIPYAMNARTHSDAQVAQIAASIREFGFNSPVLTDGRNGIVAGHGRTLAARKLGLKRVPTIDLAHLDEARKRAYILADNKLALNAGWDDDILASELGSLAELDVDLSLIGFDDEDLKRLLNGVDPGGEGLTDPDDVPEAPVHPVTRRGDVWILGRHRIICGDSTHAGDVAKVLNGVRPHLMVTDPPYGVEYDPAWRGATERTGKVLNDDRADWREAYALFPGDVAYVWHASLYGHVFAASLIASGFELRSQIIWAKPQLQLSRGHYHWQHEPCWYAVRKGGTGHWAGDRKQTTLWSISHKDQDAKTVHGTQKPVECMKRPIENNSSPGQAVYEPFSGSGSTIIACETLGRACHAVELSAQYVDVAVKRWEQFTGQAAILEGDGRTFAEMAAARPMDAPAGAEV